MLATLLIWLSVAVALLALADLFLSQAQKTWLSNALIKTWSVLDEAKSWSFADWLKKPSSLLKNLKSSVFVLRFSSSYKRSVRFGSGW
jgi:hypothetical protein